MVPYPARPSYFPGSQRIDNPGILPMRDDEPGTALMASGRILDGHGQPLADAKLEIYHAADNCTTPACTTTASPRTTCAAACSPTPRAPTPSQPSRLAYVDPVTAAVDGVAEAAAAIGRSSYRPAHVHYEVHHPDLIPSQRPRCVAWTVHAL